MKSEAEQDFGDKYSKQTIALLDFIKNRHVIKGKKQQQKVRRNQSVQNIKRVQTLNKVKSRKNNKILVDGGSLNEGIQLVPIKKDDNFKQSVKQKVNKERPNQEIKVEISDKQRQSDHQLSNADLSDVIETVGNNDSIDTHSKGVVTIKKSKPGSQNTKSRPQVSSLKAPQKLLK